MQLQNQIRQWSQIQFQKPKQKQGWNLDQKLKQKLKQKQEQKRLKPHSTRWLFPN